MLGRKAGSMFRISSLWDWLRDIRVFRVSLLRVLLVGMGLAALIAAGMLLHYYNRYSNLIDERLSGKDIRSESRIFTSPRRIVIGETMTLNQISSYLESAGYSTTPDTDSLGTILLGGYSIDIRPSENSYFKGKNAIHIEFTRQRITLLRSLDNGNRLFSADIEPELMTDLFGRSREKRREVRYEEFPEMLMNAVLSIEDKRFFDHPGFDPIRILGATWADIRSGEKAQGASTITMQVARSYFFSTRRVWRRKFQETLMALILEHRFSKKQIFEFYANEIYLGNRGSFGIHGFGEAAQAYFGKDIRRLNLAQTCFLAGIIHAPNRYSSSDRRPERAAEARDRVLNMMVTNEQITEKQAQEAREMPLQLVSGNYGASPSGHFVDMIKDDLLEKYSEDELNSRSYRVYTTMDADLQRAAVSAVDWGLKNVDTQMAKTYARWRKQGKDVPEPQAALVALDPHTGEIKALVGGRDYATSQLNHALAQRQPGSVFKPFVYAAAFETALDGNESVLTPISTVVDEPTTFYFDGKEYTPNNYGQEFHSTVTLREALVRSLNVATVKVAETVGYKRVVDFAKRLKLESNIKPTPAIALGAYEVAPLDIAAAYTAFANSGTRCEPISILRVASRGKYVLQDTVLHRRSVLDPRIAYMITNVLEDVVNHGTGAGVRSRGFYAPAAGKTGTSHDGWFAGYTSNLLCIVWVGFDDNRELGLAGANSAGPIWAEFMKKAIALPGFSNTQAFERPEGVVSVTIDPETRQVAAADCPQTREEVFIAGTEPTETCSLHGGSAFERIPPVSWLVSLFHWKK
jgi:penicillin-binding protein 1B